MQSLRLTLFRAGWWGMALCAIPALVAQPVPVGPPVNVGPPNVIAIARTTITAALWNEPTIDTTKPRASFPARLVNVSIRARVANGAEPLTAGAVVRGPGTLPTLVRAIGPGLAQFGVTNPLAGPELAVFRGTDLAAQTNVVTNSAPAAAAYVGAFPAMPATNGVANGDAALVGAPEAGMLTARCSSGTGASGIALLEFYDTDPAASATSARFVNFSSRARVETGEGVVAVGFVVAGSGEIRLLLRAAGPSLAAFNVAGTLADPALELYSGNTLIAANDNWQAPGTTAALALQIAARSAGAFDLTSANDAAMIVTLRAGSYTLHVRGAAAQSGVALAEIYELPASEAFDAAQSTNAVGLDLFRELARQRSGQNLILSPYSIESALALAYAGADGDTRTEMARVLRLPANDAPLQSGFTELRNALAQLADDSKRIADARQRSTGTPTDPIQWNAANRLFGQRDYAFRDSFLTLMRDGFAAPFEAMDFVRSPEPSRLAINAWVEEQTRQKIKDLIPSGAIDGLTRLVLVNALYLKAPWDAPFNKALTAPRPFHPTPTSSVDVPTMQRQTDLGYAAEDGFSVVTLDYLGGGLQFVIVLPDAGQNVDAIAARLTAADFARWARLRDTALRDVILFLPKFTVESPPLPLTNALMTLGMRSAFDDPIGSANFDRMAPRRGSDYLSISGVYHKTFVALDEEGTEAAAATAVVVGTTSIIIRPPPLEVRVDRPFLFAIQHRASGACLFFGRIADPR